MFNVRGVRTPATWEMTKSVAVLLPKLNRNEEHTFSPVIATDDDTGLRGQCRHFEQFLDLHKLMDVYKALLVLDAKHAQGMLFNLVKVLKNVHVDQRYH